MDDNIFKKIFCEKFICKYNTDLSCMSECSIKMHYNLKGKNEGRILSNLHIQQILRNRYFNIEFYKLNYPDLQNMRPEQLIDHYIEHGKKEGRIVSKTHAQKLTENPDFDIEFYKLNYSDLQNMRPEQLIDHYIEHGKKEGRICNVNQSYSINKIKICIIYVYYERKNEQKNQTNLAFFIKYGLDKSRWRNINITTLFIINGNQCELLIPKMENIHILYNNNEYDVISQKKGIQYFESLYKTQFYNSFTHLFIMNASVFGPVYEEGLDKHWLDPFLSNLNNNTVLCTPCINFLKKEDAGGPGPRVQSYCSLIKIDKYIYDLLLNTQISNLATGTTNTGILLEYDYIFGNKNNMHNIILIGEYGISRILLDNRYNISCLIYDNIDYNDKSLWDKYSDKIDRIPNMMPITTITRYLIDRVIIYKDIFIIKDLDTGRIFRYKLNKSSVFFLKKIRMNKLTKQEAANYFFENAELLNEIVPHTSEGEEV